MNLLNILIFLVFSSTICSAINNNNNYWVDYTSPLTENCGTKEEPCQAIKNILALPSLNNSTQSIINLKAGTYDGFLNRDITLNYNDIKIISNEGFSLIDCQQISYGFQIFNSKLELENIIIMNCVGKDGSVIYASKSKLVQKNVKFTKNVADRGGAVFLYDTSLSCINCEYFGNLAISDGNAIYTSAPSQSQSNLQFISSTINCNFMVTPPPSYVYQYDVYLERSAAVFRKSNITYMGTYCSNSEAHSSQTGQMINDNTIDSLCYTRATCPRSPVFNVDNFVQKNQVPIFCNRDGVCNGRETCLNCPSDCQKCRFPGAAFSLYNSAQCIKENNITVSNETCILPGYPLPLSSFELKNLFTSSESHGNITGYFKLETDDTVKIQITGKNLGFNLYINHINVLKSHTLLGNFTQTKSLFIKSLQTNSIKLSIFTPPTISRGTVTLKIIGSNGNDITCFYSQNVCGDGVVDQNENCLLDSTKAISGLGNSNPKCGDGICNEVPETCLKDCYHVLGKSCVSQVQPGVNKIPQTDTISHLINNHYDFSLPGLAYFSHGVNMATGEELPTVIFDIGYCDNITYSIIEDAYREAIYNIPPEYYAEILPVCNYDSLITSFESSSAIQNGQVEENEMAFSFGARADFGRWGGTANLAYSKSKSVETSKNLEGKSSGQTISIKVKCITSTVTRNSVRFHKNFVRDISAITSVPEMADFIEKYGAIFYTSSSLGGSLEVQIHVSSNANLEQNSEKIKQSSEIASSASFKSPYGGASASYSNSDDSEVEQETQVEFEEKTSKSQVLVRGGRLGSFGPDYGAPATYSEWAKTVDLRPVPIDNKVDFVGNIIPPAWTIDLTEKKCLIYRKENCDPDLAVCNCTVTNEDPCKEFDEKDCTDSIDTITTESVQKVWAEGYKLYVERNTDLEAENLYMLDVHFIFLVNPPSTPEDVSRLSNLTIEFVGTNGQKQSTMTNVTLEIGCTMAKKGCQVVISNKDDVFTSDFELDYMNIYCLNPVTKAREFLDVHKYFKDIIVHSATPKSSRGYIVNVDLVWDHNDYSVDLDAKIYQSPTPVAAPIPGSYKEDHSNGTYHLITKYCNVTNEFEPGVNNSLPYYLVTEKCNIHYSYYFKVPPQPLFTIYPDIGKTKLLFTTINFNGRGLKFYPVIVGDLGVNNGVITPIAGDIVHYRSNFDFSSGNVQDIIMTFSNNDPKIESSYDDLFVLWVCESGNFKCNDNTSPEYVKKGYIKLTRGTSFSSELNFIRYNVLIPKPSSI